MKFASKNRRYSKKRKSPATYRQQKLQQLQHDQQQQQHHDKQPSSSTANNSGFRKLANKSEIKLNHSDLFTKLFIYRITIEKE